MKNRFTLGVILFCICTIIASILACLFADEIVITIISTVSTLIGLAGLIIGFSMDRSISEASFLLDLHKTFRSNEEAQRIAIKLEHVFLGKEVQITEADREDIVAYLTFFEMFASMYDRRVISIASFDPLFGYDFFIAVNNEKVKEIELTPYKHYYVEIHKLKPAWEKYRRKRNLPIPFFNDGTPKK